MSHGPRPERLAVIWSTGARNDLRAIDRNVALQILHCLDRYSLTRSGDIKKLTPPEINFRLRCGDYRVFFRPENDTAIRIVNVRHRGEAYR